MEYRLNKDGELVIFGSLCEYGVRPWSACGEIFPFIIDEEVQKVRLTEDNKIREYFKEHHRLPSGLELGFD